MSSIDYIKGILDISLPDIDEDTRIELAESIAQAVYGKGTDPVTVYLTYHAKNGDSQPTSIGDTTVIMPISIKGNPFKLSPQEVYEGKGVIMVTGVLKKLERKYGRRDPWGKQDGQ